LITASARLGRHRLPSITGLTTRPRPWQESTLWCADIWPSYYDTIRYDRRD